MKSFKFFGAVSRSESNLDTFRNIGRVHSKVVLFFIIGNSRDSVKLVNWSRLNLSNDMQPMIPKENNFLPLCHNCTIHFYSQVHIDD